MENFNPPFIPGDKGQQDKYEQMMAEALKSPEVVPPELTPAQEAHNNRMLAVDTVAKSVLINNGSGVGTGAALMAIGYDRYAILAGLGVTAGVGVLRAISATMRARRLESASE